MSRTLSSAFLSALYGSRTTEAVLVLLTIDHDDLSTPIRLSSDEVDTTSNGDTYTAYPFKIQLPDDPENGVSRGRITVDNVNRLLVESVRSISTPPTVDIAVVLSSDPDTVEIEFTGFEMTNITYDAYEVSGTIQIQSFSREPYPALAFLPNQFPGLFV